MSINFIGMVLSLFVSTVLGGIFKLMMRPISNLMEATGYFDADTYSVMSQYCEDLTEKARNGELSEAIGRDKQIDTVINTLTREGKGNPFLVGDAGVGKTALVEGLAVKISRGDVPEEFKNKKIMKVNMVNLIAGKSYGSGNPVSRIRALFENAKNDKDIILFIDEFHQVVQCHAGDIFKMYLDRGEVKVIAATTTTEFSYISKDPALERRFTKVDIEEPSLEESLKILAGISPKLEKENNVKISNGSIIATINLTDRHMRNKNFPDKAIDVMRSAVKLASRRPEGERIVTEQDIKEIISNETCIPLDDFNDSKLDELNNMPERIKKIVIGQDNVVDKVCGAVIRGRLGMSEVNRPRASFIFAGPSGVGKTLLCDILGVEIGSMVEIDMSYYKDKNSIADFTGAKLHGSKTELSDKVWKQPYSVVVFDKIEKACPEVIDIITSILEKGYMLSSGGRRIDFTNTIIIMTTNIGEDIIIGNESENSENIEKSVISRVSSRFSNGICGKVDDILVFKKLLDKDVKKIISKCLSDTVSQLERLKIKVEFDDEVVEFLSKQSGDTYLGMLYICKQVKDKISIPISNMVVSKKIDKSKKIKCTVVEDKIKFNIID